MFENCPTNFSLSPVPSRYLELAVRALFVFQLRLPRQTEVRRTVTMNHTLPGEDLISEGIQDLRLGRETIAALLVAIGAPKLRSIGLELPSFDLPSPEHRLYDLLAVDDSDSAHSRYNALIRRLVSFERAASCVK